MTAPLPAVQTDPAALVGAARVSGLHSPQSIGGFQALLGNIRNGYRKNERDRIDS